VVTSSLSYHDFDDGTGYDFEDLDGYTGISSAAASMAAGMGIVVCNSAGNSGPGSSTCYPPADAHDIVTVGAVDEAGLLAGFSSRGPTYDGRIKPEVVARGVQTACATASSNTSYGSASGTSLSTPLVAGVACLLIQANPGFTPEMIRQSLMETADNAADPNNNYGWGLVDALGAVGWGADFVADTTVGEPPLTVSFDDSSSLAATAWTWDFGDGDSAFIEAPTHTYTTAGVFDVSLTIQTGFGDITKTKPGYVMTFGDTAAYELDSVWAGQQTMLSVDLINTQPAERIVVPIRFEDEPLVEFDSAAVGARTGYFERFRSIVYDPGNNRYAWELVADIGGGSAPLPAGSGEVLKLWFTVDPAATEGTLNTVDSASGSTLLEISSPYATYQPVSRAGGIYVRVSQRGDVNGDGLINVSDLVHLATYMFQFGPPPVTTKAGDVAGDGGIDISDLVYLADYMFGGGPPPPTD
jgi:PKD repeat protein